MIEYLTVEKGCILLSEGKVIIQLAYGKKYLSAEIRRENIIAEVSPKAAPGVANPLDAVEAALDNPIGSGTLAEIVQKKRPGKVAIVVNDVTRPTPYKYMLPPLLKQLQDAGVNDRQIVFVVATGIHRGNTDQENRDTLTPEVVDRYRVLNHDCDRNLVSLGRLSDGSELIINREVAEAGMVITTGLISLHYFAGYSGGRKSILPGVAARHLITGNHAKMTDLRATAGNYRDNPVHKVMMEAARMAGVDFILNVVTNTEKEIVAAVAGDLEEAWLAGVRVCEHISLVKVPRAADVVVAGAGGHPKDINVYQAQKALENAAAAVKPGGTIILVAQCKEGYGEEVFEQWIEEANTLDDIFRRFERQFVLGGHKAFAIAKVVKEKQIILVSDLTKTETEKLFFRYAASLDEALSLVRREYGHGFRAYIMPQAGLVLPQIQ